MAHEHHAATGHLRTEAEIKLEMVERQKAIDRLRYEMQPYHSDHPVFLAKMELINKHTSILAVLRWVLGEDLLWE